MNNEHLEKQKIEQAKRLSEIQDCCRFCGENEITYTFGKNTPAECDLCRTCAGTIYYDFKIMFAPYTLLPDLPEKQTCTHHSHDVYGPVKMGPNPSEMTAEELKKCFSETLERMGFAVPEEKVCKWESIIEKIKKWRASFPEKVFPEPNLKKIHIILTDNGITLDSISAHITRNVLDIIINEIIEVTE